MTVIDDYLQKVDQSQRGKLERIVGIVRQVVPDAQEVISYRIPAFTYHGHAFLGFALYKKHIGIYPFGGEVIEVLKDKLTDYELSKGTIRVPLDKPISESILKQVIHYRLKQIDKQLSD